MNQNLQIYCVILAAAILNSCQCLLHSGLGSRDEANLVRKLFNGTVPYNPLIRPAQNISDLIKVKMSLSFIQLISVDERNQVMKSNIWLNIQWRDLQLVWNKSEHGGIEIIRMIPEMVWQPDIVLFNNADGRYEVSYKSRVLITHDGLVQYIPPAIYRSSCRIDVKYFPFDQQTCELKFGSWTFNADQVDLDFANDFHFVDLSDYVISGTWDVINCPGFIRRFRGSHSTPNRTRIDYQIVLRRKTLFYTVNLIIPCVLISLLSICVFYLPADEGEKMTLSISILLALVVFLLLLQKILPPTSSSIPLIASYLLFTMILNVFSILITVVIINCSFRTPRTHTMPQWVYTFFIERLSRILWMSPQPKAHRGDDMTPNNLPSGDPVDSAAAAAAFNTLEGNLDSVIQATEYGTLIVNRDAYQSEPDDEEEGDYAGDNTFAPSEYSNADCGDIVMTPRNQSQLQWNRFTYGAPSTRSAKKVTYYENVVVSGQAGEHNNNLFSSSGFGAGERVKRMTNISFTQAGEFVTECLGGGHNGRVAEEGRRRSSMRRGTEQSMYSNCPDPGDPRRPREKIWISFEDQLEQLLNSGGGREVAVTQELYKSVKAIRYIARHIRQSDAHDAVLKDWKYIGLVMDRLLLIIFLIVTISGTIGIFMESPHIFDFIEQQEIIERLTKAKEQHSGGAPPIITPTTSNVGEFTGTPPPWPPPITSMQ